MGASYYWYKDNGICVRCATCMKYQRAAGRESYLKKLEERSKKA